MAFSTDIWTRTIAVALTGASGSQYGLRLVECLIRAKVRVYLMVSQAGQVVIKMESGLDVPARPAEAERFFADRFGAEAGQLRVFGRQEWTAPVASGTNPPDAMVVCPCTAGTLATLAAGMSQDLSDRAADVALKEGWKLIIVIRETPFRIHPETPLWVGNVTVQHKKVILDLLAVPATITGDTAQIGSVMQDFAALDPVRPDVDGPILLRGNPAGRPRPEVGSKPS